MYIGELVRRLGWLWFRSESARGLLFTKSKKNTIVGLSWADGDKKGGFAMTI
jgi:hypothetical protein